MLLVRVILSGLVTNRACEAVLDLIKGDRKSSIREAERFVGGKDA